MTAPGTDINDMDDFKGVVRELATFADPDQIGFQRLVEKPILGLRQLPWGKSVRRPEDLRGRSDIPEPLVRRVSYGLAGGVDELCAIGNGQVPIVAANAYTILENRFCRLYKGRS